MRQQAFVMGAVALFGCSSAWAGVGGAGVTVQGHLYPMPGVRSLDYAAPGPMVCLGGTGAGFSDRGLRIGGDLSHCQGRFGVSMTRGGGQVGFRTPGQRLYWTAYAGLGLGTFRDRTPRTGVFRSAFLYVEPTSSLGIVTRAGAVEVGLQSLLSLHGVQWVSAGEARSLLQATYGVHVRAMFGRFGQARRGHHRAQEAELPLAVPTTLPPPPVDGPPPPPTAAPASMPLAVPVDAGDVPVDAEAPASEVEPNEEPPREEASQPSSESTDAGQEAASSVETSDEDAGTSTGD